MNPFSCNGRSSQHCHSTAGYSPHICGLPQHQHRGLGAILAAQSVRWSSDTNWLTESPFPAGYFRRSCQRGIQHPAESHFFKASLSCAWSCDSPEGEENVEFIWLSGAQKDGGNMWERVRGPQKKNTIEWHVPISTVEQKSQQQHKTLNERFSHTELISCHQLLLLFSNRNTIYLLWELKK